ncbi:MAG: ABC transporter permease subunit, partial [Clostridia bacterium]
AMGSYPVPHYLKFDTLATKYVEMNVFRQGERSIIAVLMMIIGVIILVINQYSTSGRKNYTTVTGKSGQVSLINLGKVGKYVIGIILIIITVFTSIYPIISFAIETFLPNPGDYSGFTTKWWITSNITQENGMYGQMGILYNTNIWNSFKGTLIVSISCALLAGTLGLLVGYAVSKSRKSKWAAYVNNIAFLPYLLPSIAIGAAFFVFGAELGLYDTYLLLIIVGTIKYIPFASRSALNSMLQLSGEIEESAVIQNIPWYKRMFNIIIPIQKTSILSGYLLPFITCLREFTLLCGQGTILTTQLDYFDEMGLYALSSGINLILILVILICNFVINKLTGASLDKGIGGK